MNSNISAVSDIEKNMTKLTMAFHSSALGQTIKQINKANLQIERAFKPFLDAMKESSDQIKMLFSNMDQSLDLIRNLVEPVSLQKLEWLSKICEISPTLQSPKRKLVEINGDEITFNSKTTRYRKLESIHRTLLIILLKNSDEKGFLSYEQIEKFLRQENFEAIESIKDSRKRTRNSRDAIMRFLDIPKTYNGIKLIETISKKGLKLNNPTI